MKKEPKVSVSDIDPVPLYRSYGVTKKEGFLAHFNVIWARIIYTAIMAVWLVGLGAAVSVMLKLLGSLGTLIVIIAALLFVYLKLLKNIRIRLKFISKLRRACKKNGFLLVFSRGFWRSMRFNTEGCDFIVETPHVLYCVRFFTVKKQNTHVTLKDKRTVEIKGGIRESKMRMLYGMGPKFKIRTIPYTFEAPTNIPQTARQKQIRCCVVINPMPSAIYKVDVNGARVATGSGEEMYGYTIYSGTGFIETLHRNNDT